jgi:hypothetical protein
LGWNPEAPEFQGLVGGETWAIELTGLELQDFCRLLQELATTLQDMATVLMDEERIRCEVESATLWLEAEGYPHAYSLQLILHQGRKAEGCWPETAVPELLEAVRLLGVM